MEETQQAIDTEYYAAFAKNYEFYITNIAKKGKGVKSKNSLPTNEEILQEVPLVAWPIAFANSEIIFCENCLMFSTYQGKRSSPVKETSSKRSRLNNNKASNETQTASQKTETQTSSSNYTPISSKDGPYFCSRMCAYQALGNSEDASKFYSDLDDEHTEPKDSTLAGWMTFLSYKEMIELRRVQSVVHPHNDQPITLEALARVISKIASTTLQFSKELEIPTEVAYSLAWQPFERFISPDNLQGYDLTFLQTVLTETMGERMRVNLSEEIRYHLLHDSTLKLLFGKLLLNSQSLHIWGSVPKGDLSLITAAGIYTLQSCFNHSCNPNCSVSCMWDSSIAINTLKPTNPHDELTISYIPTELPFKERKTLLDNFLFQCDCERCIQQS